MATVLLAEALLRRKELQQKVDQLKAIKEKDLFVVKGRRQQLTDNIEEVTLQVQRCTLAEVTAEYDFYAKQLRLCDAAIQRANLESRVEVGEDVMKDWLDVHPEMAVQKAS